MLILCCCAGCIEEYTVPSFPNTTMVDNYTTGAATITPYSRPWNYYTTGSCILEECDVPDEPVCRFRGFDGSTDETAGITPGGDVPPRYLNGFEDSGTTTTISNPCYGWKGVAAHAVWQGRSGFINSDLDGSLECCDGQAQTRYKTITSTTSAHFVSTYTAVACDGSTTVYAREYILEMSQSATVDSYGNVTRTGSISVSCVSTTDTGSGPVPDGQCDIDGCTIGDNTGDRFAGSAAPYYFNDAIIPRFDLPLDAACGIIGVGGGGTALDMPSYSGTATELNDMEIFAPSAGQAGNAPCDDPHLPAITIDGTSHAAVFELTDTRLEVSWEMGGTWVQGVCCDPDPNKTNTQVSSLTFTKVVELSNGHSFGDVKQEAKDMLEEWDLNDDASYPWRYDSSTWLVPFMSRDAAAVEPTIDWTVVGGVGDDKCDFIGSGEYTGELRGIPNPAGYGRHFNFTHIVYITGLDVTTCVVCEGSLGELSYSPLPATATQWTNDVDGANMHGPGGWITHRIQGQYGAFGSWPDALDRGVTMQKWAETIESWPSLNYARPCARDRYLFDEDAIACVIDYTDPDLEIEDTPLSGPTEFAVNDIIVITDGVYQVTGKTDAQNYTVSARLYDALVSCDGASKLRFPSARAICGELEVSVAEELTPGVVTITLTEKHWFKRGGSQSDTVNFTDVPGLGSGLTVTVIDDYSFTVPGTLGAWTSGGTISQTGAQTAWNNTCPRRKYITREWQSRLREWDPEDSGDLPWTLTETERSYSYKSNKPYIVVISPNAGDTPLHGVRYDFGDIDADLCFGEEWHMDVAQAMADPFWQTPHVPCGWGGGAFEQDSAPCAGDGDYEYPPLVEAMLSAPSGAPSLPLDTPTGYPTGESGSPGPVSHPNCEPTPYDRGTLHAIRAAWEACTEWIEKTMHRC